MQGVRLIGKRKQKIINRINHWGKKLQLQGINVKQLQNNKHLGFKGWAKLTTKELTGYCSRLAEFYYSQKP